jgi:hypothetical protein
VVQLAVPAEEPSAEAAEAAAGRAQLDQLLGELADVKRELGIEDDVAPEVAAAPAEEPVTAAPSEAVASEGAASEGAPAPASEEPVARSAEPEPEAVPAVEAAVAQPEPELAPAAPKSFEMLEDEKATAAAKQGCACALM